MTVSKDPGPLQSPGTVAELPLNAADCAVGTASLQATADALGLVVAPPDPAAGPGPTGCAAGDTLTTAIAAVIITRSRTDPVPELASRSRSTRSFPAPEPGPLVLQSRSAQCPSGIGLVLLPAVQGVVRGALS